MSLYIKRSLIWGLILIIGTLFLKEKCLILAVDNIKPIIEILNPPDKGITLSDNATLKIIWKDTDPDDNARINLYWDSDKNINNNNDENKGKRWGIIFSNIAEDPDLCADEQDIYNLKVVGVPTWCPWSRYFYILATIEDKSKEIFYDYSGKVVVLTKANSKGVAISSKGARIFTPPFYFPEDVYLSIIEDLNDKSVSIANLKLIRRKDIHTNRKLNRTIYKFKALGIKGNIYKVSFINKENFKGKILISIPYDKEIKDSLKIGEENLRIFYLNEYKNCWEAVDGRHIINKEKKEVTVLVNKLGIYRLVEVLGESDNVWHYPNPLNYIHEDRIYFKNLKSDYTLKIYNILGEEIRTFKGSKDYWDLRDNENRIVGSGIYYYLIYDAKGRIIHRDKIAIIK